MQTSDADEYRARIRAKSKELLLAPLNLGGVSLEIAPYFRPMITRENRVIYVDYVSTEENMEKAARNPGYQNQPITEVDYIWLPGKRLRECIPAEIQFDCAVGAHVLEHVPDTIGWLNDILATLKTGAILGLAIPDKLRNCDIHRPLSSVPELVGAWIEKRSVQSPTQIFDFMANSVSEWEDPAKYAREYSDEEALRTAVWTYNENKYLDAHCTVWTPESFKEVIERIAALGIMNVAVSQPAKIRGVRGDEFIVHLTKLGEPAVTHETLGVRTHSL